MTTLTFTGTFNILLLLQEAEVACPWLLSDPDFHGGRPDASTITVHYNELIAPADAEAQITAVVAKHNPTGLSDVEQLLLDQQRAQQKINEVMTPLVGRLTTSLTTAERFQLLEVVLFKLGVVDYNRTVKAYNDWHEIGSA